MENDCNKKEWQESEERLRYIEAAEYYSLMAKMSKYKNIIQPFIDLVTSVEEYEKDNST